MTHNDFFRFVITLK